MIKINFNDKSEKNQSSTIELHIACDLDMYQSLSIAKTTLTPFFIKKEQII